MEKVNAIKLLVKDATIFPILILFLITVFTNTLSTLKTMFVSKNILKPVYIIVFIDAIIFATIMKQITSGDGGASMIAYALGKSVGVFVGGLVEEKLAIGINQVDLILSNKEKVIKVADDLRKAGYSVNNKLVYGYKGNKRYTVETIVSRKEFDNYLKILKENDIINPTLTIKNLNKVTGKINPEPLN